MAMHIDGTAKESRKRDRRERFSDAEKIRLSLPRKQDLDAAGLDPDEAVLDDVDPADPVGPRDLVGVREELQGVGLRGRADRERVRNAAQMKATWRRGVSSPCKSLVTRNTTRSYEHALAQSSRRVDWGV
mgnify:CR=1 FL=1